MFLSYVAVCDSVVINNIYLRYSKCKWRYYCVVLLSIDIKLCKDHIYVLYITISEKYMKTSLGYTVFFGFFFWGGGGSISFPNLLNFFNNKKILADQLKPT